MKSLRAAILAALFAICSFVQAVAQDVTLIARDGAVEISGTLLGFDGDFYRIDTTFGTLTVDGTGVNCEGPGCPNLTNFVAEVVVSGASSMSDVLLPALVEAFALRHGYSVLRDDAMTNRLIYELSDSQDGAVVARFTFLATSTDEGFADLLADEADIALALREVRSDEARLGLDAGLGDLRQDNRARVLALSALVPVSARGNSVRTVSAQDLARVFAGRITNWRDLGGADAEIALHLPSDGSGLLQSIEDELMRPLQLRFADNITYHKRLSALTRAVENDPFALGLSTYERSGDAQVLTLSGGCGHQIIAGHQTIKTEDYPLTTPLYLYVPALRQPKIVREFLRYARSSAAQTVIRRAGYVDLGTEHMPIAQQGLRLSNAILQAGEEVQLEALQVMMRDLNAMTRLSTTFRFSAGRSVMDAHSMSNVDVLASEIEHGAYDGRELVFVGFSDASGGAEANQRVSEKRAAEVLVAVRNAAKAADLSQVKLSSRGYGEALPIACDSTAWGRQVNRRVEVWLR